MKTKGFIFDLDGVIVDTAKYHYLAWKALAKSIGIDFTVHQNEQLKGISRESSLNKILEWGNKTLPKDKFMELMKEKNNQYLSYITTMDENEILPGVTQILDYISQRKHPIALGSASKNSKIILQKVNLLDWFDAIVDGNNVTKAKPDPEVFLKAAKAINTPANQCIVFEDSVAGIQAANVANMISIGIGDSTILNEADFVFKDFTEIHVDFLERLIKTKKEELKKV
ncbi:beta-phosphoglucomutase [Snuella sedimenti]|uniref:Beta-phosphoglucomutase n=1 Tax=Snuella sedimenti TaxID=2798802 RepID=A0A8J7J200_9FLAO|nr:beta-phosphoglucomutase [Snuella sedimenti]MBJ6368272.1 beta-phosphoglucomutase [Snuella sedimenti]